jgi:hypothetical protein
MTTRSIEITVETDEVILHQAAIAVSSGTVPPPPRSLEHVRRRDNKE